ncbi:MAG TPA: hypothetical protein VFV94_15920, partial [Polyangiaceae bacterium]|nr:hypothetical protein [Polyangiaceae bacterium]
MNPSDVLSPEIVDLGLAIGLLKQSGGPVEFDSDWFSDPGPRVTQALADDDRRAALVRFVDAVNGPSDATRTGGVTLVKVFDASELGIADAPRLVVNVAIDDSSDTYVEVGVAITHSTTGPETHTDLVVPLYRTGKRLGSELATVPEPFALAAGSPIRLQSTLSLGSGEPDASGFGLRGVAVTVNVPFTGAEVGVEIDLQGLRLPGSTAPVDIQIGGDGASLEHALLSLVIGAVRAAAAALGSAGHAALAALDLIGLGSDPALPALDLSQLAAEGVAALRSWFAEAMADQTRRRAWLDALGTVIGGTRSGDVLAVALGGGPVNLELSVAAAAGTGGHLRVTPRVGLELSTLIGAGAGAVRLRAEGSIEAMTVDLADGAVTPIPSAELHVTLEGNGARLLDTGPIRIGSAELGIALKAGVVVPLVRLLDVVVEGTPHEVVDLSSADAVVAAAGNVASDLLVAAIDAFGDAAPHLKALLGLVPPVGMDPLDAGQLLVNPPGALAAWWHALLFDHADLVAGVLEHLRDLLAHDSVLVMPVSGSGTAASPWSLRLVDRVSLDAWLDGSTFVVAVTLGSRVDTLAGGCTVVNVAARAELLALDLEAGHASLLRGASLTASLRGRGMTEARLSLGPVAVVADSLGVAARWSAAAGFSVSLEAPNLAADLGDDQRVPLALPLGATWQTSVFADVESLVGVLGATNPSGWLHDLVDLLGWTFGSEESPHKLHLAGLATDAAAELRTWAQKLATDERVVSRVTSALARVLTGSTDGRAGALTGTGKPRDPWVLPLGVGADAPALSLSLGPDGPRLDPSTTGDALRTWRPGLPGLGAAGLAQAVFDEARAGDDVAALSFARAGLGTGLEALVERVVGTDVLVSAPPSPPAPPAG